MSDLVSGLVALIGAIPTAVANADEADRERLLVALDRAKAGLASITPNASTIAEAIERRRAELKP